MIATSDDHVPITHPEVVFSDSRGEIIDLVENEVFDSACWITTVAGAVRGNHYHLDTYQVTYVVRGRLRFASQLPGATAVTYIAETGDLVRTRPKESHAVEALSDSTMLVLTRGPRGGRNYESDTYRLDKPLIPG